MEKQNRKIVVSGGHTKYYGEGSVLIY